MKIKLHYRWTFGNKRGKGKVILLTSKTAKDKSKSTFVKMLSVKKTTKSLRKLTLVTS